jgi:tight adherence protein B
MTMRIIAVGLEIPDRRGAAAVLKGWVRRPRPTQSTVTAVTVATGRPRNRTPIQTAGRPVPVVAAAAGGFRSPGPRQSALAAAVAGVLVSVALRSPMPFLLLPLIAAVLSVRHRRRCRWAEHDAQRDAIAALCTALRAELEAGLQPRSAFMSAVWSRPELRDLAEASGRPGAELDLPVLLAGHSLRPGRRALRALSACWYAAERHGLALADAVAGIEEGLRAEQARLRAVEVELAGIRATILLLAALPLFGLALGLALGADPLGTLLHRPIGRLGLAVGTVLDLAGLLWTDRLVAGVRPEAAMTTSSGRARV